MTPALLERCLAYGIEGYPTEYQRGSDYREDASCPTHGLPPVTASDDRGRSRVFRCVCPEGCTYEVPVVAPVAA